MTNSLNFFGIIALIGGTQGILMSFAMLQRSDAAHSARRVHGLLSLVYALLTYSIALSQLNFYANHRFWMLMTICLLFLPGPLVLRYLKSLTNSEAKSNSNLTLHIIPFAGAIIFSLLLLCIEQGNTATTDMGQDRGSMIFIEFLSAAGALHIIGYNIYSHYLKMRLVKANKQVFSNLINRDLRWITNFQLFALLIFTYMILLSLLPLMNLTIREDAYSFIAVLATVAFIYNSYNAYQQEDMHADLINLDKGIQKYQHSRLELDKAEEMKKQIINTLIEEQLYLNPDLKLNDLARKTKIQGHTLSQVLNEHLHVSFYDLVNSHRIDKAKEELAKSENNKYTILSIALACGYNSKSVFNEAFKRFTGTTPSKFRSELS